MPIDVAVLAFLPLDEAVASTAVIVIVSGSDGQAGETLLGPVEKLKNGMSIGS